MGPVRRTKRVVKALFGRYVSRDVYHQLIEHPGLARRGLGAWHVAVR